MDETLSKRLKECGWPRKDIEITLKMPANSLSGMINGSRATPIKWAVKLKVFVDNLVSLPPDYVEIRHVKIVDGNGKVSNLFPKKEIEAPAVPEIKLSPYEAYYEEVTSVGNVAALNATMRVVKTDKSLSFKEKERLELYAKKIGSTLEF